MAHCAEDTSSKKSLPFLICHDGKVYDSFVDLLTASDSYAELPYRVFIYDYVKIFDSLFSGVLSWPDAFPDERVRLIFENIMGICIAPSLIAISNSVSLLFLQEFYADFISQTLNFHKICFRQKNTEAKNSANTVSKSNTLAVETPVSQENSVNVNGNSSKEKDKLRPSGQDATPPTSNKKNKGKRKNKKRDRGSDSEIETPNSKTVVEPGVLANYIEGNDNDVNNVNFTDNCDDPPAEQADSGELPQNSNSFPASVEGAATAEKRDKRYNITFFVEFPGKWKDFLADLKNATKIIPDAKLSGAFLKITVHDSDSFRTVQNYLQKKQVKYQTLDPQDERPKKFLFRGIPPRTPENELLAFVESHGFHVVRVTNMRNRKTKHPMPLYLVACRPSPNLERIYDIDSYNYLKITVEEFHDSDVKQCYNCQGYGHSSFTCYLKPKCVRCAQPHKTAECPLPKNEKNATCANCLGPHPASYRGCPKNPKNRGKKNTKAVPLNAAQNTRSQSTAKNPGSYGAPITTYNRFGPLVVSREESSDCDTDCSSDIMEIDTATAQAAQPSTSKGTVNGKLINTSSLCAPINTSTKKKKKKKKTNKNSDKNSKNSDTIPMNSNAAVVDAAPQVQRHPPPAPPTSRARIRSQKPSENSSSSLAADILEILNILKTFLKDLNLKSIIQMFKTFVNIFKSDKPIDAIYALLEQFVYSNGSHTNHG